MSYVFQSSRGVNWEDLDDDDLKIFAPDKEEVDVENAPEKVEPLSANCVYENTPNSLNLAWQKHFNEVWDVCRALPAHKKLSFDQYYYYPQMRVQYKTNWLEFKQCMGRYVSTPMLMKFSLLRLSLTREYDGEGGFVIREGGELIDGPLFPHAEFAPLPDNSEPEEERDESQTPPPRSPPCMPGTRSDDELEGVC